MADDEARVDIADNTPAPDVIPEPQTTLQTDPTPVETTTPTPDVDPAPQSTFSFREHAKQYGLSVDQFETDQDAADAVLRHLASSQQPKADPKPEPTPEPAEEEWSPEKHFSQFWDVPQYKPEWDDLLAVNSRTGQVEPKGTVPWGAAQQAMNEYAQWQAARAKAMRGLFESANPFQKFYEAALPALERAFAKRDDITQELSSREEENVISNFEQAHSQWLAAEEGQQFISYAKELVNNDGIAPVRAMQIASRAFKPQPNGAAVQSATTPEPEPKPADTSFVDDAIAKAGHRPSGSASSTTPDSQGAKSADEIRNMFKSAFAQSQTAK